MMMGSTLLIFGGMLLMLVPLIDDGIDIWEQFLGIQHSLWAAYRAEAGTPRDMGELLARIDDPKVRPIRAALSGDKL